MREHFHRHIMKYKLNGWEREREVLCVCFYAEKDRETHSHDIHFCGSMSVLSLFFHMYVCFEPSYFFLLCLFRVSLRRKSQADCVLSPTQADNR